MRDYVPVRWRAQARAAALVAAADPPVPGSSPSLCPPLVELLLRVVRRWSAGARRARQLPEALDRMAAALRTGSSVQQALAEAAAASEPPLGHELARLERETSRGRALRDVLDDWVRRHGDNGTRLTACALVVASATGAMPARALDGVAATLRDRLDLARERRALATQARASAVVLSAAPVLFATILVLSRPAAARFMLGTPVGWACLAVGLGLDGVGAVCMWRMTRGAR